MTYPDKEERRILEAWNEFERWLEPPELAEGVREKLLARRRRRPVRYALAIAAAALALAVGALAAAGSFEWLLGSADPRFGEVVEPVGRSSTVEGVRLELIAAQRFGDMCAVYVSLTDTELAGRVTDAPVYSSFKINRRGLSSGECELIYYDAERQCAVYEFVFSNFSDEALESVSVELTNMPTGGLVTLPDAVLELRPDEVVTGVSELVDGEGLPITPLGRLEEIPDASGWWIAGAGVGGDGFTVILRQPMSPSNNYVYAPGELGRGDTLLYNDGPRLARKPLPFDGGRPGNQAADRQEHISRRGWRALLFLRRGARRAVYRPELQGGRGRARRRAALLRAELCRNAERPAACRGRAGRRRNAEPHRRHRGRRRQPLPRRRHCGEPDGR